MQARKGETNEIIVQSQLEYASQKTTAKVASKQLTN